MFRYPFLDLRKLNSAMVPDLLQAATRVIESGRYIGGEEVDSLAKRLKSITGKQFCIPVSNGLDGLRLSLRALVETRRIEAGSEVIVPVNSFIASALAIVDAGLKPVFVDPDAESLLLDDEQLESHLSGRTSVVMPVDLYGRVWMNPSLISRMRQRGILLVEDAAQALGAHAADGSPAGGIGDISVFSFYPTKNVGALGDAGAVLTSEPDMAETIRSLANYGRDADSRYSLNGFNCRMDPIQAAMLCVKLDWIDRENEARRKNASFYREAIANLSILLPGDEHGMIYHQFVVRIKRDRERFRRFLSDHGVETAIHYSTPLDREPCMRQFVVEPSIKAKEIADSIVSLPISSATTRDDIYAISKIINSFA